MIKDLIVKIMVEKSEVDLNNPDTNPIIISSSGTGFFIKNNYILTCYHVIKEHLKITISHHSSRKKKIVVDVHSIYPDDDLAVLYVDSKKYFGDIQVSNDNIHILNHHLSDDENSVLVYGYPLNSNHLKKSKGMLSGFQDSMFQTDATLNPGNSGGPLIWNNKIIGINVAKLSSDKIDNVGYAIPIQRFLIYKNTLDVTDKIYKKPSLQMRLQNIENNDQFIKFGLNLPKDNNGDYYGVRIIKLLNSSVFKKEGLKTGDFLLEWDGKKIDMYGDINTNFYPEKINISEICKWYYLGQMIDIKYYCTDTNLIKSKTVKLNKSNLLIPYFYKNYTNNYYYTISNLTFSIITKYHILNIKKLELEMEDKVYILNSFFNMDNDFFIYLVKQLPTDNTVKLPEGCVVTKINNKEINSYSQLQKLKFVYSIQFLSGEKYYL